MRTASSASMRRPVRERSSAARRPTTRCSGASAMYGKKPTSISGVPKRASSAATAKSQAATSPRPPASAEPLAHATRSEEHTSELQSQFHLVCRLLLEKKKKSNKDRRRKLTHHGKNKRL